MHPGVENGTKSDLRDLMLTSSIDWTVKLWYPKHRNEPIQTYEYSQEYIYDVQWSPVHPSVFATCDGDGFVDIWDINKDTESPQVRKKLRDEAINTIRWSEDGKKIAVGDSDGYLSIWALDKDFYMPKSDDQTKMERLVASMQPSVGSV